MLRLLSTIVLVGIAWLNGAARGADVHATAQHIHGDIDQAGQYILDGIEHIACLAIGQGSNQFRRSVVQIIKTYR